MKFYQNKFLILFLILAIGFYSFSAKTAEAGWFSKITKAISKAVSSTYKAINYVVASVEIVIGGMLSSVGIDNQLVEDANCRWGSSKNPIQDFTGCKKTPKGNPIVPSAPVPTLDLNAPAIVEIPDPINLLWRAINANTCLASGDWSGNKTPIDSNGGYLSESISKPRGNYTFDLSCSGAGGSVSKSINSQVIEVPKCSFWADPSTITLPNSSKLSQTCSYADSCSINQNIGTVCSSETDCSTDNLIVRPTATTTFTLTCQGLDGARSWQATVGIGQPGDIKYEEVIP